MMLLQKGLPIPVALPFQLGRLNLGRSIGQFGPVGTGDRTTLVALSNHSCTESETIRLLPARSFDVPARGHYCSGLALTRMSANATRQSDTRDGRPPRSPSLVTTR